MHAGDPFPPDEFWAHQRDIENHVRAASAAMAIYGLRWWDGPVMLGPWEWENDAVVMAGLRHGDPERDGEPCVDVYVTDADPSRKVVKLMMSAMGLTAFSPNYKERRAALHAAAPTPTRVTVDDASVTFDAFGGDSRWWASGTVGSTGIVAEGRNCAPTELALTRVDDIEPYLAGLRRHLTIAREKD